MDATAEVVVSTDGTAPMANTEPAPVIAETPEAKFTQADLDRILGERLAKEKQRTAEAAAKATAEAERKAAEEQGRFQELYQATLTELETERNTRRSLELSAMRRDVAQRLNLPGALADRLIGETPEELEADGKRLLAALPKPAAPNINAGSPAGVLPAGVMSEEERKERAARLGVDWRFFNP